MQMQTITDVRAFLRLQSQWHARQASRDRLSDAKKRVHAHLSEEFAIAEAIIESDELGRVADLERQIPIGVTTRLGPVDDDAREHGDGNVVRFLPTAATRQANDDIFSVDPLDLAGLPEELAGELYITKAELADAQVYELLRMAGRPLNINELLVGLYRKYGEKHKRNSIAARLYRLCTRGTLASPTKGSYELVARREAAA